MPKSYLGYYNASVVRGSVEQWHPVSADPARSGLGVARAARLAQTQAPRTVLASSYAVVRARDTR